MINKNDSILERINSPADLKLLSDDELKKLSDEIRKKIVDTVSQNGGHLASNLGVVELTIALHSVFNCPEDKIVWDVGHQSYAHKILTGRCSRINTIRRENGLSGFPKRSESKYDCFDTGHSSTSISAAFGIACAESAKNSDACTVAVIGDGALSGGLAFEGLNNAGRSGKNLIVVLNDNKMSISQNVGSMARYLSHLRVKPTYLQAKTKVHGFEKVPIIGKPVTQSMKGIKDWMRDDFFGQKNNIFSQLGFAYYGPYDGHDIQELKAVFKAVKHKHSPVLIHVRTKKGKGYEYAEKNPKVFHGVSSFDVETGETKCSSVGYSDVFGKLMCGLAEKDERICAITAAMSIGTGLNQFYKKYKDRFYDVGIAEEHAVTFAAGLAAGGMLPVFAVYSTFLQRSYDQILHDAALQNLHIVLAVDRAGIVGEDGETHQGIYDTAFLNTMPNVTIYSPSCFEELKVMLTRALFDTDGVAVVRYPRGGETYIPDDFEVSSEPFDIYGDMDSDILMVTYGREFSQLCLARENLIKKGVSSCILKLNTIKPLPEEAAAISKKFRYVFFFEEGVKSGGIGERFGLSLYQSGFAGRFSLTALDGFVAQAKTSSALHNAGLDAEMTETKILNDINSGGTANAGKKTT